MGTVRTEATDRKRKLLIVLGFLIAIVGAVACPHQSPTCGPDVSLGSYARRSSIGVLVPLKSGKSSRFQVEPLEVADER